MALFAGNFLTNAINHADNVHIIISITVVCDFILKFAVNKSERERKGRKDSNR